jgi:hypothetical protein
MKIVYKKIFKWSLRISITLSAIIYFFVVLGEGTPPFTEPLFGVAMVYVLFLFFLLGYYHVWKNEKFSGKIFIAWYILLWALALFVWTNAGLTLVMGFPIFVLGILFLIFGIFNKK